MKKKINFILLALLIFFTNTQTSYAAKNNGLGDAAVLKITMETLFYRFLCLIQTYRIKKDLLEI